MLGRLLRIGRGALDLLLPPHCLTCDAQVATQGAFCAGCFRLTRMTGGLCCDACGIPLERRKKKKTELVEEGETEGEKEEGEDKKKEEEEPVPVGPVFCADCTVSPPPWGRGRAAMVYDAQSRRVILPFKHADRPELAGALAGMMARAGADVLAAADVIVPVPLHRARLVARRYNQSALLAQALGRMAGKTAVLDALVRVRLTAPLGERVAAERAAEVEGAIAIRPGRAAMLEGQRVLLVDDVLTSGATARVCTWALLEGGVAGVDVLVVARAGRSRVLGQGETVGAAT